MTSIKESWKKVSSWLSKRIQGPEEQNAAGGSSGSSCETSNGMLRSPDAEGCTTQAEHQHQHASQTHASTSCSQQHQQQHQDEKQVVPRAPPPPTDTREFFAEYGEANRYLIREVIGKGSYGIVCSAIDQFTGERVAIKKITNVFEHTSDATRILREIKLLRLLKHPDIVEIKHIMLPPSARDFKDIYVVFELMETDLHQVIKANDDLTPDHHQFFLYQMLRGLKYIHSAKVFHRDLKPKNILANSDCKLKICDFGLARPAFNDVPTAILWTDYVATRWYRAPELCGSFFAKYSPAIDIWSVGCIFAEVLLGKPLFPGKNVAHQLEIITELLGSPAPHVLEKVRNEKARRFLMSMRPKPGIPFRAFFPNAAPAALDLLKRMLAFDPADRPTAEEALADPYFAGLHSPSREPVSQPVSKIAFEFDRRKLEMADVRELIYREILEYHPEVLQAYLGNGMRSAFVNPSALDNFKRQFLHLEQNPGAVLDIKGNPVPAPQQTAQQAQQRVPAQQAQQAGAMAAQHGGGMYNVDLSPQQQQQHHVPQQQHQLQHAHTMPRRNSTATTGSSSYHQVIHPHDMGNGGEVILIDGDDLMRGNAQPAQYQQQQQQPVYQPQRYTPSPPQQQQQQLQQQRSNTQTRSIQQSPFIPYGMAAQHALTPQYHAAYPNNVVQQQSSVVHPRSGGMQHAQQAQRGGTFLPNGSTGSQILGGQFTQHAQQAIMPQQYSYGCNGNGPQTAQYGCGNEQMEWECEQDRPTHIALTGAALRQDMPSTSTGQHRFLHSYSSVPNPHVHHDDLMYASAARAQQRQQDGNVVQRSGSILHVDAQPMVAVQAGFNGAAMDRMQADSASSTSTTVSVTRSHDHHVHGIPHAAEFLAVRGM